MLKKMNSWLLLVVGVVMISGCATTSKNYQPDIDSLNARISTLQGQLSAKDEEIGRMNGQLSDQQSALNQAETDKRLLSEKLDTTLSQLEEKSRKAVMEPRVDSDLK